MRRLMWFLASVLVVFGVLTAHYTIGEGVAHHAEWADKYGVPRPSFALFALGMATTVLGSVWMGWLLARRRRA